MSQKSQFSKLSKPKQELVLRQMSGNLMLQFDLLIRGIRANPDLIDRRAELVQLNFALGTIQKIIADKEKMNVHGFTDHLNNMAKEITES